MAMLYNYKETFTNVFGEQVFDNEKYLNEDNPFMLYDGMPSYQFIEREILKQFEFIFKTEDDWKAFQERVTDIIPESRVYYWWNKPQMDLTYKGKIWTDTTGGLYMPKYPLYIISKSRFERRMTSDYLCRMGIPHNIVVEEQQYDDYRSRTDPKMVRILILDPEYQRKYNTCDDEPETLSKGSGPARNFSWEHSISEGHKKHWIIDDNILDFKRVGTNSKRLKCISPAFWRAMEDHTDRFSNVMLSGPQYQSFMCPTPRMPPFVVNTRLYSCILINNDLPFRWEGRYNEDVHLSIRTLKAGYCTMQYNTFLQDKMATQTCKGGNTEAFYSFKGTLPKSEMLKRLHPDCVEVVWKFGRWHHTVDYSRFKKNRLILADGATWEPGINEYGMELTDEQQ